MFSPPVSWDSDCQPVGEGSVRVVLAGELDLHTAAISERLLADAQADAPVLVLDLARLEFIDVVGLHVLQDAHDRARRSGGRFSIRHAHGCVRWLLDLCGGTDHLGVPAAIATRRQLQQTP